MQVPTDIIYYDETGGFVVGRTVRRNIRRREKFIEEITYLKTDIDDDLKFINYIKTKNDKNRRKRFSILTELFSSQFAEVAQKVNESGKLSFIDFRNFLINKTEERLDYVTKNIDRYKLDCPADAVYTIDKLKKEQNFLTKEKIKNIERIGDLLNTYGKLKNGTRFKSVITEKSIFESFESLDTLVQKVNKRLNFVEDKIEELQHLAENDSSIRPPKERVSIWTGLFEGFTKNPKPCLKVIEKLAKQLNITKSYVKLWFLNEHRQLEEFAKRTNVQLIQDDESNETDSFIGNIKIEELNQICTNSAAVDIGDLQMVDRSADKNEDLINEQLIGENDGELINKSEIDECELVAKSENDSADQPSEIDSDDFDKLSIEDFLVIGFEDKMNLDDSAI